MNLNQEEAGMIEIGGKVNRYIERVRSLLSKETDEADAYRAGLDCARHGANEGNCHFQFFASPKLTAAWERGHADGKSDT